MTLPIERARSRRPVTWLTILGVLLLPAVIGGLLVAALYNPNERLSTMNAAVVNDDHAVTIDGQLAPLGRQLTAGLVKGGGATKATSVAFAGSPLTLTESFSSGNAANYNASLECRRNSDNAVVATSGTGLSRTVTMPSGTALTCSWTNSRKSATLVMRKSWANALVADAVTVTTSGLVNNVSLLSVANSANETDTNAAVTVYAAETATLAESYSVGSGGNYTQALACTGNASPLAGNQLTVSAADTAIVCTFTNSRIAQ